jgi:hypothetical protein
MKIHPKTRDMARRLLEYEAIATKPAESAECVTLRVYEKLRQSLVPFAGIAAFESLASRALTLARPEAPSLGAVQITADGSIRGLSDFKPQINNDRNQNDHDQANERGVILIARLLGLLLIFLGEALTLSLLQVQWPSAVFDDHNSGNGRKV